MTTIDLNADLGEGEATDEALLEVVTSCNVACGGHAGDESSMRATVVSALRHGVEIGAHPAYPDREGFGRRPNVVAGPKLYESLTGQVTALADIAAALGAVLRHIKAHGALYNDAGRDPALAEILARVAAEAPGDVALVGQAGSAVESAAGATGIRFIAEAFIDRAYREDGSLVPRSAPGSVYSDIERMTAQALALARARPLRTVSGADLRIRAQTLCIHGDTRGAVQAALAVRAALLENGIGIAAASRAR